jgi:hypothetical protein
MDGKLKKAFNKLSEQQLRTKKKLELSKKPRQVESNGPNNQNQDKTKMYLFYFGEGK